VITDVGDIGRFRRPEQLASRAGLTPKHDESDITVHHGRITKKARGWCVRPRSRPCNAASGNRGASAGLACVGGRRGCLDRRVGGRRNPFGQYPLRRPCHWPD